MKKITRRSFLQATGVAALTSFAACGNDNNTAGTGASSAVVDADLYTEVGTYPIIKEGKELTLDLFMPLRPALTSYDASKNKFTAHLEELTGLTLTFQSPSETDSKARLNVMMTGGTYTDAIVNTTMVPSEQLLYGQQGILIPLNDLIENNAPNIKRVLDENPAIKANFTMTDGNMYVLPSIGKAIHTQTAHRMWLNKTWLDNLGLNVPTTTEEFFEVLKAFKEGDPNGNGNTGDEVPLSGSLTGWNTDPMAFLMNAFIPCSPNNKYFNVSEDGKVYYAKTTDAWKEGLKYLKSLYQAGVMDEMLFSQTKDQLLKLGSNPGDILLGATTGGSVAVFCNTSDYDRWNNYIALPPLTGPDGVRSAAMIADYGNAALAITNKCKHPEAVIRMFDYMFTEEGCNGANVGFPGDGQIDYAPEGAVNFIGEPADFIRLPDDNVQDVSWNRCGPDYRWPEWDLQFAAKDDPRTDIERVLYLSAVDSYVPCLPAIERLAPPVALDTEDSRVFVDVETTMFPYIDQITIEFITGVKDIDAEWDNYLSALEGYGLPNYLEIYQAALDAKA